MISRTIERYGRRRSILMLTGVVWIFYGVAVIVGPRNNPVSGLPHTYIPEEIRFFLWFVSGIIAITAAFWQSKHGRAEALGFAVLYVMPAERTLSYLISWISAHPSVPGEGLPWGWLYALQYLSFVGIIYICAGWPDPRRETL